MRRQTECNLTVRLSWVVAPGNHHPEHTYTCAQDEEMAAELALRAELTQSAHAKFAGVDVSPDGGRKVAWQAIDLDEYLAAKERESSIR